MKKIHLEQLNEVIGENKIDLSTYFSETILKQAKLFIYDSKEYIVRFDKQVEHLFFVIEGRAKIYKIHENGRRSLIQFLGGGDFIGELSLLEVEKQVKDVQAIDRCVCLTLPYQKVKQDLLNDPHFLRILAQYLGEKVLLRVEHFSNNQNYELKHRLAAYMLQTEVEGVYTEKQTETAEYLGVSYRHLMYTLTEFQKNEVVIREGKSYHLNQAKLKQLAQGLSDF